MVSKTGRRGVLFLPVCFKDKDMLASLENTKVVGILIISKTHVDSVFD